MRNNWHHYLVVSWVGILLISAGCSISPSKKESSLPSPTASSKASETPSPEPILQNLCALIEKGELETILESELNDPKQATLPDSDFSSLSAQTCLWTAKSGAFSPVVLITVSSPAGLTAESDGSPELQPAIEQLSQLWLRDQQKFESSQRYELIPDLPQAAFFSPEGVHFLTNNTVTKVSVSQSQPNKNRETALKVAQIILPILP